jgi:serine/threonine protein kinase
MEYVEQGDLFTYLKVSKQPLPEKEVAEIMYQILVGLDMMHENKFAHRDLKPQVSVPGSSSSELHTDIISRISW